MTQVVEGLGLDEGGPQLDGSDALGLDVKLFGESILVSSQKLQRLFGVVQRFRPMAPHGVNTGSHEHSVLE